MLRISSCTFGVLVCFVALALSQDPVAPAAVSVKSENVVASPSLSKPAEDPSKKSDSTNVAIHSTKAPDHTSTPNSDVSSSPVPAISGNVTTTSVPSISPNVTTTFVPPISPNVTTTPVPPISPNVTTTSVSPISPNVTSTVPPPAPTTVAPKPQKGSWNITENNSTCIILEGIILVNVEFTTKNETTHKGTNHVKISVPKFANATGSCTDEKVKLLWSNNSLEFAFKKNDSEKNYALTDVSGAIFIPDANSTQHFNFDNKSRYFVTPLNQSYSCSATKKISVNGKVNVELESFKLQAFKTSKGSGFDESVDCSNSPQTTPDIVPIIVGCVLALLIISILVAYLISRRRSQARGYLSM